ncbi:MAG: hypothetical protein WDZ63_03960 [Burkholderiales bacterium]
MQMNTATTQSAWRNDLLRQGAAFEHDRVVHFGDRDAELSQAEVATACSPLTDYRTLRVGGKDAGAFLQAQLTCDVRLITGVHAQLGGYCTPKGRLLATFLAWMHDADYMLQVPATLAETVAARLHRYVLRSNVTVDVDPGLALIGLTGPHATRAMAEILGSAADAPLKVVRSGSIVAIRAFGESLVVAVPETQVLDLWERLLGHARPAGAPAWEWGQIQSGVVWITPPTQDLFLPQMVGLDANGGVSFDKGCYPGQEIVARAHYLGDLKRQLYRVHSDINSEPGDGLFATGSAEPVGTVVNAAPAPRGGWDALAVLRREALHQEIRLARTSGPMVTALAPAGAAMSAA